jgi:hypothetical protein
MMVQALFGEIKGFLDKDFLFASFVPVLVFLASISATFAGVVGFDGSLGWIETFTVAQSTALVGVTFLGTVVFAYIVNSLRMVFLKLWTGAHGALTPLLLLGESWNQAKYAEADKAAYRVPEWKTIIDEFSSTLQKYYKEPGTSEVITDTELTDLLSKITGARLESIVSSDKAAAFLENTVLPAYKNFAWNDALNDVYQNLITVFETKAGEEQSNIISRRFRLDRRFGTKDTIRATTLGNIVESYNAYPFKRYGMEGEVFWPHLQHYVPEAFMKRISEQKIIFDFCLTMATLGVCYGFLAVVVGPFLSSNVWFWVILGVLVVVFSYAVYYRLAVFVATQYGDLIRASFDLFRWDLLKAFLKVEPSITTLPKEREVWMELSRLLAYGDPASIMFEASRTSRSSSSSLTPAGSKP